MPTGEVDEKVDELRDAVARHDRILDESPGLPAAGPLDDRREEGATDLPEGRLTPRIVGDLDRSAQAIPRRQVLDDRLCDAAQVSLVEFDEEHGLRGRGHPERIPIKETERAAIDGLECTRAHREHVGDDNPPSPETFQVPGA